MKTIPLHGKYGEGKFAKVSDEDYEFLSSLKWWVDDKGYAKTYYQGKHRPMHQLVAERMQRMQRIHGKPVKGIDHRNQDKLDNQRENLRQATISQNNANIKNRAKTGYKGVYSVQGAKTFNASIFYQGKMRSLGNFSNPRWAAMAYTIAALDIHGEFASLDFTPDEILS